MSEEGIANHKRLFMEDFEIELKRDFLEESEDLLSTAESAFLRLEEERNDSDLLNEIFRVAHNLKGTSKAVGFDQMAQLTHVAENLILKLKEGKLEVSDKIVSGLLEFKDMVAEMITGLMEDLDAEFDIAKVVENLEHLTNGEQAESKQHNIEHSSEFDNIQDEPSLDEIPGSDEFSAEDAMDLADAIDDLPTESEAETAQMTEDGGGDIELSSAALESLAELGMDISELVGEQASSQPESKNESLKFNNMESLNPVQEQVATVAEDNKPVAKDVSAVSSKKEEKKAASVEESIRVGLSKIDKINNVIGELVILQTVLSQRRFVNIDDDLSNKSISMMSKLFKEVQEVAMSLRMLPLKGAFQKMTRIVRDTTKLLGKEAKLVMIGEDTEVDKTVMERISDPLVHIVRNAIDHGLELPEDRVAAGKDPKGRVELRAFHEGSNLAIEIKDDGKGIDSEVIRKKAVAKGIISENSQLSSDEIIQFIFHPGFSTKEQVTEVSGRGVGMDVVKTNIEQLGGQVKLESKVGEGSCFKILIPLTLAIIEGLVVSSDEQKFVVPLSQIYELTQVKNTDIETFTGSAKLFRLRGEVMPMFNLSKKLGLKEKESDSNIVIIVRGNGKAFGVAIDDALRQQQIVIKKLGEDLRGREGIMGSAIMSDGKPSLIVDLHELFRSEMKENKAHKRFIEQARAA